MSLDSSARAGRAPTSSPLLSWLSLSSFDAVGRMLLQVAGTMLFARLLGPEYFGLSALTIACVAAVSTVATSLFEEALTRRLRVRKAHFRAALTIVLALAALMYSVILGVAAWAPFALGGTADLALSFAAFYGLILFADSTQSIYIALARRMRRFQDLTLANLVGAFGGTTTGLLVAWLGGGVWGLLAVPFVGQFLSLAVLILRCPVRILPTVALLPAREMTRFGGYFVAGRCLHSIMDGVAQGLVTRYFGLEGNGYLNMAMRIVEPLRGITASISHNISMAYFAPLQTEPQRLSKALHQTVAESALILQPIFVGVAVTAPTVLLVIAGPDWTASAAIAVPLALAGALGSATNILRSGLSARGRADLWLLSGAVELTFLAAALTLLSPLGLVAAGLARLVASIADSVFVLSAARRVCSVIVVDVLRPLAIVSVCTLLMSLAVLGVQALDKAIVPLLRLALEVGVGVLVYALAVMAIRGESIRALRDRLWSPGA